MLLHLQIENYALIEGLRIDFSRGLTVITGETGAGKSILLGALSLVLGQRAETQVLSNPEKKCIIEACFRIPSGVLRPLFEKHQLDFEEDTIVRREISPQGKSRAFINDTPVTLPVMKEIAGSLVDIHSQHQNLLLGASSFQFDVLDNYTGNVSRVGAYQIAYQELQDMKRRLHAREEQEKKSRAEQDYLRFQLDELDRAGLDPEAASLWEEELEVLRHAEEIGSGLAGAVHRLSEADRSVTGTLYEVLQLIRPLSSYRTDFDSMAGRLEAALIELKDLSADMERAAGDVQHDPARMRELEGKTDLVNKLLHKHQVPDVEALVALREDYREKITALDGLEESVAGLRLQVSRSEAALREMAGEISRVRHAGIPELEGEITAMLRQLAMPAARFKVGLEPLSQPGPFGMDQPMFLFSANAGTELREISRVASGGEMSRLMLGIKNTLSRKNMLSTIVFDEIDTGISGETGGRIGKILRSMAGQMQVIAITHLPQIAALGKDHYLVFKTEYKGRTRTGIKRLAGEERKIEIAKMLGGEDPSRSMVRTAGELMQQKTENH